MEGHELDQAALTADNIIRFKLAYDITADGVSLTDITTDQVRALSEEDLRSLMYAAVLLIAEHKGDVAERARVAADLFGAIADVMTAVGAPTIAAAEHMLNGPNDPRHDWGLAAAIADRLILARRPDGSRVYGDGIDGRHWTVYEVLYLLSFGDFSLGDDEEDVGAVLGVEHQPRV